MVLQLIYTKKTLPEELRQIRKMIDNLENQNS
jgi:hypothetical protein